MAKVLFFYPDVDFDRLLRQMKHEVDPDKIEYRLRERLKSMGGSGKYFGFQAAMILLEAYNKGLRQRRLDPEAMSLRPAAASSLATK